MADRAKMIDWDEVIRTLDANFHFRTPSQGAGHRQSYRASSNGPTLDIWVEDSSMFIELPIKVPELSEHQVNNTMPSQNRFRYSVNDGIGILAGIKALNGVAKEIKSFQQPNHINQKLNISNMENIPLNTILYGPPGTGKTYQTAKHAVEICDGSAPKDRKELMARYKELKEAGRVVFVTFHQSFSYEDFVEGIRPEVKDEKLNYEVKDGVFKRVCELAKKNVSLKSGASEKLLKGKRVFKMSLGNTLDPAEAGVYRDCIANNYVLLGYGGGLDYSQCQTMADVINKYREFDPEAKDRDYNITAAHYLKNEMQIGDIVIISDGNTKFRAIGQISGDYKHVSRDDGFDQMRPVEWLAIFEDSLNVDVILSKRLSQMSIYLPDPSAIKWSALESLLMPGKQNYVLIIDEINRANISKVFGELITLLEPDKRIGQDNELSVVLPYSGDDFSVPDNIYLIGTMNTADRSIALLDTALRRRFDFVEMMPEPQLLGEVEGINLEQILQSINKRIEHLYDRDHTIGHAYLMSCISLIDLNQAFRRKIIPLLQEYFYEDWSKVKLVLNDSEGLFISARNSIISGDDDGREIYGVNSIDFSADAFRNIY